MLKQRSEQIQLAVRTADFLIGVAAFFLAYQLRLLPTVSVSYGPIGPVESLVWLLATSLGLHFVLYPYLGFYTSLRLKSLPEILLMVLKALVAEFFMLGALVFLVKAKDTSRYFFGLYLALNYGLVLAEKGGARVLLTSIRRRGYNFRQVLVVGTGVNATQVIQALRRNKHWGYIPFGILVEGDGAQAIDGVPVVGRLAEMEAVTRSHAVDEVYFALDRFDAREIGDQLALCERLGIPARFSLAFTELSRSKVTFNNLDHIPVLTFYTTLMTPAEAFAKRVMDVVIAFVGLLITAALFPWIAWKIRRESPGPVIFKNLRVGENGRRFKCYKFRTMFEGADARKAELAAKNQMDGPIFKIADDPRITKFGAFLRRTSLDELPQFFNILRGDMSVVGTRPPTPDEVSRYETHYRRRLSIRPGLTGLWQVSGRNSIQRFEDILALDLRYIDEWSIWLDVRIIARTIWVTLFRRGAY
jgi:exopolysaccharide biosynthesis polyprenyl glycosylphosphotransferase